MTLVKPGGSWVIRLVLISLVASSCGTAILDPIVKASASNPDGSSGSTPDSSFDGSADGSPDVTRDGNPHSNLDTGLVAHWTFDEKMGTVARDASPFQRDGVFTGTGGWIPGRFSGALSLKRGDRVVVSNFPVAAVNFSLSFWVRFSAGDLGSGRTSMIGNEAASGGWDLNAPDGSNPPMIQFAFPSANGGGPGGHESASCCTPALDTWQHITVTFDAATRTIAMFDGGTKRTSSVTNNLIQPGSSTLTIGGASGQFQGSIDEVRIYDRVLTPAEITALDTVP